MLPLPALPALFGKSSSQSISQAELPHITAPHAQKRDATRAEFAFQQRQKLLPLKILSLLLGLGRLRET